MDAILRLMKENTIKDYDLSENAAIHHGAFSSYPFPGGWCFDSSEAVEVNGEERKNGQLQIGDVLVLDYETETAALILEKVTGVSMMVDLSGDTVGELTLGRKPGNSIELQDSMISGRHCRIFKKAGGWYVEDLGSTNGTYVNDRLREACRLKKGDVLKLGRYRLRFGDKLCVENADARVVFHVPAAEATPADRFEKRPYPWFSRAPRIQRELPPLYLRIESAPSIGEKPTMGMGGIALSPQLLALSLGMQALRYGLGRRKYSKQEKLRAEVYANYLAGIEAQLQQHADLQRAHEELLHPSAADCMKLPEGPSLNLWSRHPGDKDFLTLRLGVGKVPAAARVELPQLRLQLKEEELDRVPEQLAEKYAVVDKVPLYADLMQDGSCGLVGPRECMISVARSMIAQLAALHSYEEVKIVALFSEQEKAEWSWMRWLPHVFSEERTVRYIGCGAEAKTVLQSLEPMIKQRMEQKNQWSFGAQAANLPHYVFLVADPSLLHRTAVGTALMANQPELGISGIFLGQTTADFPHSVKHILELSGSPVLMQMCLKTGAGEKRLLSEENYILKTQYDRFARAMAPIRLLDGQAKKQGIPASVGLLEGLGIRNPEQLEIGDYWENTACEKSLAVPIGIKSGGERFYFNIHEKGDGPHGMVAGASGSGKSQMAQAWIMSMALQFSPEDVNFVLVDFKGKSLIQPLLELPHLAGTISNLDKDIARSFAAMESELDRRQQRLAEYKCTDIIEYHKKRRLNPQMPAMPYIFLIIDEFAELKQQFPDFTKPLEHLYRGGRSLGMCVIVMTQSPSGIVTEQMRNNARFRWCLSVMSESDSREMLGTTEGASIRIPGRAYVRAGDTYELIQSFFAGMPYQAQREKKTEMNSHVYAVALNGERAEKTDGAKKPAYTGKTELDVLLAVICDYCRRSQISPAKRLWEKELPERVDLYSLKGQGQPWTEEKGWLSSCSQETAGRTEAKFDSRSAATGPGAVLGLVDDPFHQRQFPLYHDFWKQGHLAVYGMPVSGRTTFLQTLLVSLCSRYTPEEVQLYLIDIGGFGLRAMETFPHVGAAAGDDEPEVMEKIAGLFRTEITRRKKLFRNVGVGSPAAYAETTGKALPTLLLMVDNLNQMGHQFPEFMNFLIQLSKEGASYGVYLVCSFTGTNGVPYQLEPNIKTRIALQLAEKNEYTGVVGKLNQPGISSQMGRGFVKGADGPLMFQTAIAFEALSDSMRTSKLRQMADAMNRQYQGERPAGFVKVPETLEYGSIEGEPLILGMDPADGQTVRVEPKLNQSLFISDGTVGSESSGIISGAAKSVSDGAAVDFLRSLIRQAVSIRDVQVILYSPRPEHFTDIMAGQQFITKAQELDAVIEPLRTELRRRQGLLKQAADLEFPPIFVVLDGLYQCIFEAQKETIGRLEVFIRLGKGLNFTVIAADTAELAAKSRREDSLLTATLRQGAVVLLGGMLAVHQLVDTYDLRKRHPKPLEETEGCLVNGNEGVFFKRMLGD